MKILKRLFKKPTTDAGKLRLGVVVTLIGIFTGLNVSPLFNGSGETKYLHIEQGTIKTNSPPLFKGD